MKKGLPSVLPLPAAGSLNSLVDTATGAHLWADRFGGGLGDIFDLQDQVSLARLAARYQRDVELCRQLMSAMNRFSSRL